MGEQHSVKFPQEVIDEYAALGVDLPALFSAGDLGTRMGIEIVEASANGSSAPCRSRATPSRTACCTAGPPACSPRPSARSASALHGGSTTARRRRRPQRTHHRGVRSGLVTGVATPVHRGRSTATYEIVITDEEGKRVCTARLTCLLRDVQPNGAAA